MNNLFPPELRTMAVVKRWSIVRTHYKDSVAEHSYFVVYYALQIARLLEWPGPLADLMFYALMHDVEETITGDIISPVKKTMDAESWNFVQSKMSEHLPLIGTQLDVIGDSKDGEVIKAIVKVADKVDAVLYLIGEMRLGCSHLGPLHVDALSNLREAWDYLFAVLPLTHHAQHLRDDLWDDQLYPALQAHHNYGSMGLLGAVDADDGATSNLFPF